MNDTRIQVKTAAYLSRRYSQLKITNITNALLTNIFPTVGHQPLAGRTEYAGRLKLLKNDLIVIHEYFQFVTLSNIQRSADLNRQNDPSQLIDLTNNSRGFHTQTNPFALTTD